MSEPVGKTPSRNAVQFEPTKELRMLQTMPSGIYCHQEALLDGITSEKICHITRWKAMILVIETLKTYKAGQFVVAFFFW